MNGDRNRYWYEIADLVETAAAFGDVGQLSGSCAVPREKSTLRPPRFIVAVATSFQGGNKAAQAGTNISASCSIAALLTSGAICVTSLDYVEQ